MKTPPAKPWMRFTRNAPPAAPSIMLLAALIIAGWARPPSTALGQETWALWVEGEDADQAQVVRHPWWYEQVKNDMLSGGAMMAHFVNVEGDGQPGAATYGIDVPADGEYALWARVNPTGSRTSFRLDGGEWIQLPSEWRDSINIASDGQPDLRNIAWTRAAENLWLPAGPAAIEFRFESGGGPQHHGFLDCFLLTTGRFTPAGAMKPAYLRAAPAGAGANDWVWVEGEDADERDVDINPWYQNDLKRNLLSGQALLSHYSGAGRAGEARFSVLVPSDGDYTLWARINPVLSGTSFRLEGEEWVRLPLDNDRDRVNLASNDQPDHRFLAWVRAPQRLSLQAGRRDIAFKFEHPAGQGDMHSGYLDCFLLTKNPFTPQGTAKPAGAGAPPLPADPGAWAFDPGMDHYGAEALFDLRPLLDGVAGERGWIRHDENGDFVRGDGSPIRFWAVNTGGLNDLEDIEEHARHLAKRGVNLVRAFGRLNPDGDGPIGRPHEPGIDSFQKYVAIMKKHGIYTLICPYWGTAAQAGAAGYRPFGRESGHLGGLLFWEPELQAAFKNWWRELLTRPNPYDPNGTPLKDDPAFAILQTQNEDSMLFWTQQDVRPDGPRHAEYLALDARFRDWQRQNGFSGDTPLRIDFYQIDQGGDTTRAAPEDLQWAMRFMAETMRAFNEDFERFIRDEIESPVHINAGNWITASPIRLYDHERWSYDVNGAMAKNHYVDWNTHVNHNGRGGYLVEQGDYYANVSALRDDGWRMLATNMRHVKGKPSMITESCWVPPNGYQSEGPLLVAAYSGLTGMDAYFWFALGRPGYDALIGKWQVATPSVMGGWPAAAWMHHKGYVRRGGTVVDEKRSLDGDMWELRVPVIAEDSHFDPNRPGTVRAQSHVAGGAPFGAFLTGRVEVEYGPDPALTRIDLHGQRPDDLARGVIRSTTGELSMNAPEGLFTLDAPNAQGVAGFLAAAGPQSTRDLDIALDNEYATVIAVSLDDLPLAASGKVLLQITTQSRPYGWKETPIQYQRGDRQIDGFRIDDTGSFPWNVKETRGSITIRNAALSRATLADANFYAAGDVPVRREGGALIVPLPPNAMYVVLE